VISFLWAHWYLSGIAVAALIAFVAVGMLGGWPLVLNRRVLGALGLVLAAVALMLWDESRLARERERGAALVEEANKNARIKREADNTAHEQEMEQQRNDAKASLAGALAEIDRLRRERPNRVSPKADAGCVVTRGFVRDHDDALPRSARRSKVPLAPADIDRPAAGVVLSGVRNCIDHNYSECAKLETRLAACEESRYAACVAWDKRFGTSSGCTR
jgi:hypothetical protein